MREGQGVIASPSLNKAPSEGEHIDDHGKRHPWQGRGIDHTLDARRQRHGNARITFAAHGGEVLFAKQAALNSKYG